MFARTLILGLAAAFVFVGCDGQDAETARKEFVADLEAGIRKLDARMEQFNERLDEAGDDARMKMREVHQDLVARRNALAEKLDALEAKSGDAWQELKADTKAAYEDFAQGVEDAFDHLR